MAITISGNGITSANIADGTITTDDINASDVTNLKSGRKNFVINGGFDVWQRGTTDSYSTSGGYRSADRVYVNASGGSCKLEQGTFSIDQTDVPGNPTYYGMLDVQTGNDNCGLQFRLEDEKIGANRDMTLSFWAKSSSPRLLYTSLQSFGSTSSVSAATQSFTPTSAWTKYTFTFNLGSIATVSGTTKYTRFSINQGSDTSTTAWTLDIAQVQLELGDTATDFEHRSYGEELALCKRYYATISKGIMGIGGTNAFKCSYHPEVEFRAVPSLSLSENGIRVGDMISGACQLGSATISISGYSIPNMVSLTVSGNPVTGSITGWRPYLLEPGGAGYEGVIRMDAEL